MAGSERALPKLGISLRVSEAGSTAQLRQSGGNERRKVQTRPTAWDGRPQPSGAAAAVLKRLPCKAMTGSELQLRVRSVTEAAEDRYPQTSPLPPHSNTCYGCHSPTPPLCSSHPGPSQPAPTLTSCLSSSALLSLRPSPHTPGLPSLQMPPKPFSAIQPLPHIPHLHLCISSS